MRHSFTIEGGKIVLKPGVKANNPVALLSNEARNDPAWAYSLFEKMGKYSAKRKKAMATLKKLFEGND